MKCKCMGATDAEKESTIEEAAARVELGMDLYLPHACPMMAAMATARVCGSAISQSDDPVAMKAEVLRQLDIGIAYGENMIAKSEGQHVDH